MAVEESHNVAGEVQQILNLASLSMKFKNCHYTSEQQLVSLFAYILKKSKCLVMNKSSFLYKFFVT